MNLISKFLSERIVENDFPSAVYLVAEKGEIILRDALGFAVVEPEKIEAKIDTIYDLASLSKPLVTGLICAKNIEQNLLKLSDKVAKYFPSFNPEITIENVLSHTSGLPAWKPFYLLCDSREAICGMIVLESATAKPNQTVVYSDLNFILLGFLLEKLHKKRLDEIAKVEIFEPLSLKYTFFNPPISLQKTIAASEFGNLYESNTCTELGFEIKNQTLTIRSRQIWGEVHDGNCYFMSGVSGHAGLFSTAEETFKIAQQFLPNSTQILKPETCLLFRTNFTSDMNEARSISFQLAATEKSTASESISKDSFGHLGFSGTSLWIDPNTERIFILLTNRTHAHELPFTNINSVRRKFHELSVQNLENRSKY
jgi:serine-type D-Ala-D-Ala carboxypeptidase